MNEDRIWILVARKLAGEATVEELQELTELLRQNPEASHSIAILSDWWSITEVKRCNTSPVKFDQLLLRIVKTGESFTGGTKRRKG